MCAAKIDSILLTHTIFTCMHLRYCYEDLLMMKIFHQLSTVFFFCLSLLYISKHYNNSAYSHSDFWNNVLANMYIFSLFAGSIWSRPYMYALYNKCVQLYLMYSAYSYTLLRLGINKFAYTGPMTQYHQAETSLSVCVKSHFPELIDFISLLKQFKNFRFRKHKCIIYISSII